MQDSDTRTPQEQKRRREVEMLDRPPHDLRAIVTQKKESDKQAVLFESCEELKRRVSAQQLGRSEEQKDKKERRGSQKKKLYFADMNNGGRRKEEEIEDVEGHENKRLRVQPTRHGDIPGREPWWRTRRGRGWWAGAGDGRWEPWEVGGGWW